MRFLVPLPVLLILALVSPAAAEDIPDYAVDVNGHLYKVDCESLVFRKVGKIKVPVGTTSPVVEPAGTAPTPPTPKPRGTQVRRIPPVTETPDLYDIAATADGYLYGISGTAIYLINLTEPGKSKKIGRHGLTRPYGMVAVGSVLLVNTLGGRCHLIDRKTGEATALGSMGSPFVASGDIVVMGGKLLSSVKNSSGKEHLVELDHETGKAKLIGVLETANGQAINDVFGLIEKKGVLYGFTADGKVLRVDPKTARCTILRRTKIQWWGATSYTRI